jgi:hypothetical protein
MRTTKCLLDALALFCAAGGGIKGAKGLCPYRYESMTTLG